MSLRLWALLGSLSLGLVSFAPEQKTAVASWVPLTPNSSAWKSAARPTRHLLGDWVPPKALLVSFTSSWQETLAQIVAADPSLPVLMLAPAEASLSEIDDWRLLQRLENARLTILPARIDTPWVRDYGPLQTVTRDGRYVWLDTTYGWDRPDDDALPSRLATVLDARLERVSSVLDGGGIVANGHGLCVVTEESIVRGDIDTSDDRVGQLLLTQIGCDMVVVVPALQEEKTGHVDIFIQFLSEEEAVVASMVPSEDSGDPDTLDEAAAAIEMAAYSLGKPLRVHRVHMPFYDGKYFTYINGLRLPNVFLVPSYQQVPEDEQSVAHEQLQAALGSLPILPVDATELIELAGALHCIAVGLAELPGFLSEDDKAVARARSLRLVK